jgi:hypothetical protein
LDEDEMQTLWLENVNAAFADENQGDQTNMNISWSARLLCQLAGICTQASYNCCTTSSVPRWCIFTHYGEAWNEYHEADHGSYQFRPDTSAHCRPAIICCREKFNGHGQMSLGKENMLY